jgi:hypothetical protein
MLDLEMYKYAWQTMSDRQSLDALTIVYPREIILYARFLVQKQN